MSHGRVSWRDLLNEKGMVEPEKLQRLPLEDGLALIKDERVVPLMHYLKTGVFENYNNVSFMNAYTIIVHFGDQQQHSTQLYSFYKQTITEFCNNAATYLESLRGEELLVQTAEHWDKHRILVFWMQRVFQYLDRFFTKNNNEYPDLFQTGLQCFHLQTYERIARHLRQAMVDYVNRERDGSPIDTSVMKRLVEMLCTIGDKEVKILKLKDEKGERLVWSSKEKGVYRKDWEEPLLKATGEYYLQQSAKWLQDTSMSCADYLRETDRRLKDEGKRIETYLEHSTGDPLIKEVQRQLIANRAAQLAESDSGCTRMFQDQRFDELSLMYSLFKREPETLKNMTDLMKPYIESRVSAIVEDKAKQDAPEEFVESLVQLKAEMDDMVLRCFNNEGAFEKARNYALEEVLNRDTRCAKYLAVYCDVMLKKGLKGKSDQETAQFVHRVVALFLHLRDKDIFLDVYKERLSKRLLNKQSAGKDAEDMMIAKLKVEVGQQSVAKLMSMFKDMEVSDQLQEGFCKMSHEGKISGVEVELKILTSNCWPFKPEATPLKYPREIEECIGAVKLFYESKFSGRKLTYMNTMGNVEVAASCFKKKHILQVSLYQACLLQLFNNGTSFTVKQLMDATGIDESETKRQLLSLTAPGQKALNKDASGKEMTEATVFSVNADFVSPKFKVLVQLIKKEETVKETEPAEAPDERKHVIEAILVRIMKARKKLDHNGLLEELYKQCTLFKPQPAQVKARIEHLIDREYLKRDPDSRNVYIYLP